MDLTFKSVDKIYGMKVSYFLIFGIIVCACMWLNCLPEGYVGALAILITIGGLGFWLGQSLPILRDIGGALIIPMFGTLVLKHFGFFTEDAINTVKGFLNGGYQDLYIAAIIVGAILSLNRDILLNSIARYIPTILISQIFAIGFLFIASMITGISLFQAVFFIGAPCMSGGSGAAMTTLPNMYSEMLGQDITAQSGAMFATAQLGDYTALAIVVVFSALANHFPRLLGNGHGELLRKRNEKLETAFSQKPMPKSSADYSRLGAGIFCSVTLMCLGTLFAHFLPFIAALAWTITIAILIKAFGLLPDHVCESANYWYTVLVRIGLPILIAALAIAKMDLSVLASVFTIQTWIVIIMGILGAVTGAMVGAKLFGLWPYEAALTAALCSCNIGGTGDIRMMTVADRMDLLPFASISTRIGGAMMLIEISLLFPIVARIAGIM